MVHGEVVLVTPEMASAWLDDLERPKNRRVSQREVRQIAEAIKRDEWQVTGSAVQFDAGGNLIDGQHRLEAVVLAERPVPMFVATGIEPSAIAVLDQGRKRSVADFLTIHGYADANNLAAAMGQLIVFRHYKTFSLRKANYYPTPNEVLQALREREAGVVETLKIAHLVRGKLWGVPVSTLGALLHLLGEVDHADMEEFAFQLRTGAGVDDIDAVFALRTRLMNAAASRRKLGRDEFAAITIKAWNAWRAGEPVAALSWRGGGARPEKMPEIQ